MKFALFIAYLIVEIAVFVGLVYAIGFWWTLLITLAAVVVGVVLLRRQGLKVFAELRRAADGAEDSMRPVADTVLLALSAILLVIPGIVSTVGGIALLLGPVRRLARPLVAALGARRMVVAMDRWSPGARATVVGGEVVDSTHPPHTTGWRSIQG